MFTTTMAPISTSIAPGPSMEKEKGILKIKTKPGCQTLKWVNGTYTRIVSIFLKPCTAGTCSQRIS